MAFQFGNVATLELDATAGSATDVSAYTNSGTLSIERDSTDLPRLGGHQTAQLVGPPGTTIETEGWFDTAIDAILGPWQLEANQVARTLRLGPQGSATGAVSYTSEVFLESYEAEFPADDPGSWSATFVANASGVTRSTF